MPKLILSDITNISGQESNALATLNQNWDRIETALENTFSRDGTSPNTLQTDIDLNENDILNGGNADFASLSINGVAISGADDIANVGPAGPVPELAVVADGSRRVLKVQSFIEDADAHIGEYIGSGGYTATIGSATDIRGASGAGTGDLLAANNLSDVANTTTAFSNIKKPATDTVTGVVELATFAEAIAGSGDVVINATVIKQIIDMVSPVGQVGAFLKASTAPTYWLILNGNSIGNAFSGATALASADTYTLYAILWDNFGNGELTIQTSAGAGTTRGVSALADYNANKRMPLPDYRGVFLRGLDLSRGVDTGRVIGSLQQDDFEAHTHTGTTSSNGSHNHTTTAARETNYTADFSSLLHSNNSEGNYANDGTRTSSTASDHSHTFTTASSGGTETRPINQAVMYCVRY